MDGDPRTLKCPDDPLDGVALEPTELDQFEDFLKVHGYNVLVMAPVSAPWTNLAYLPSTPLV